MENGEEEEIIDQEIPSNSNSYDFSDEEELLILEDLKKQNKLIQDNEHAMHKQMEYYKNRIKELEAIVSDKVVVSSDSFLLNAESDNTHTPHAKFNNNMQSSEYNQSPISSDGYQIPKRSSKPAPKRRTYRKEHKNANYSYNNKQRVDYLENESNNENENEFQRYISNLQSYTSSKFHEADAILSKYRGNSNLYQIEQNKEMENSDKKKIRQLKQIIHESQQQRIKEKQIIKSRLTNYVSNVKNDAEKSEKELIEFIAQQLPQFFDDYSNINKESAKIAIAKAAQALKDKSIKR